MTTSRVWNSITHSTRNCWRVEVILLFTTLKTTPALLWNYASTVRFFFYQKTSIWKCLYSVREPWRRGYHLYASALLGASTTMTTTTPRVWHCITHSTRNCWRVEVILLFTALKTTPALLWNYASKVRFLSENFDMKMSIVGLPSDLARSFGAVCAHFRYRVIHRAITYVCVI